ncbi:chondroitin proteoglycan 2-like [Actinia tenebrosa]|uniref:Chondroitin proteoglycan 2-like n=1 Tax=Actinia tenebrosa TaxID=6105 RepID=A0A6P8J3Z3_ACTTE|nr:chondroitin proteoglycan 2-like [Actinia tenebrosa]
MMKLAVILACTLVFYFAIHSAESRDFCYKRDDGDYANPVNCHMYITCSNNIAYYRQCPAKLRWNERTKTCDWPRNVKCHIKPPGHCSDNISLRSCLFLKSHNQCRKDKTVLNVFCRKTCGQC